MDKFFKKFKNKIKLLHRGNKNKFLENSKEAIISGLKDINYDGIEIDIRLTKDNKWIIYHDYNLNRLTSIDKKIRSVNYNNLPIINYKGRRYNIIKLSELINLNFTKKVINIEIKELYNINDKIKDNLLEIIKSLKSHVLISSYNWEWYIWCKKYKLNFGHLILNEEPKEYDLIILNYKKNINFKKNYNDKKKIGYHNLNKILYESNLLILDY